MLRASGEASSAPKSASRPARSPVDSTTSSATGPLSRLARPGGSITATMAAPIKTPCLRPSRQSADSGFVALGPLARRSGFKAVESDMVKGCSSQIFLGTMRQKSAIRVRCLKPDALLLTPYEPADY